MSDADTEPHGIDLESFVREGGIEMAVLRKVIYQMAGDPEDASLMEAALIALEEWEERGERLSALEGATGINIENAEYHDLSRAARIKRIKDSLRENAEKTNGRAAMDYKDVIWLFDGNPSPGYAVDLLKASEDREDGYKFEKFESRDRNNRLVIDLTKEEGGLS